MAPGEPLNLSLAYPFGIECLAYMFSKRVHVIDLETRERIMLVRCPELIRGLSEMRFGLDVEMALRFLQRGCLL